LLIKSLKFSQRSSLWILKHKWFEDLFIILSILLGLSLYFQLNIFFISCMTAYFLCLIFYFPFLCYSTIIVIKSYERENPICLPFFAKKILLLWKRSLAIYIVFLLSWSILFLTAWMLLSVIIFTILIFSLSLPILIFSLSLIICLSSLSTIFIKKFFHSEPTPNAFAKFFCMMASISYRDFPLVFSLLMKPIDT
jgi:hypothetical protein